MLAKAIVSKAPFLQKRFRWGFFAFSVALQKRQIDRIIWASCYMLVKENLKAFPCEEKPGLRRGMHAWAGPNVKGAQTKRSTCPKTSWGIGCCSRKGYCTESKYPRLQRGLGKTDSRTSESEESKWMEGVLKSMIFFCSTWPWNLK